MKKPGPGGSGQPPSEPDKPARAQAEAPPIEGELVPGPPAPARLREILPFLPPGADVVEKRFQTVYHNVGIFVSSMSIRYKIAGALIVVLCLAIASLGVVTFRQQKKVLQTEMKKLAAALARQVAISGKTGLLTKDDLNVYATIKDIQKTSGVVYAMVLDKRGKIFVHSSLWEKGKTPDGAIDKSALNAEDLIFQEATYQKEPVLDASLPIVSTFGNKNLRVGTARIGLSEKELTGAIRRQKVTYILITCLYVILGLLIAFALGRVLTRQLLILTVGMRVVAQGNLNKQVLIESRDEIGRLAQTFNEMILKLREKLHMEKYLSSSTLQLIRQRRDEKKLGLGGERKQVTALFSDIRGFTAMSEKLEPADVVELVNIYLNLQAEVIYNFGGVVDKFVGDEVMAIFTGEQGELNAARAAVEIQHYIRSLNLSREKAKKRLVQVGIGLNNGEVVMGNMGSERQMDYTVIGDPINVAARLCGAAAPSQAILSRSVADALPRDCKLNALDPVALKGKAKTVDILEVLSAPGARRRNMRRQVELPAAFALAGLSEEKYPAAVRNICREGCMFEAATPAGVGAKVELGVELEAIPELKKVHAVVRHGSRQGDHYRIGVQFESLSEGAGHKLTEWVHRIEVAAPASYEPTAPQSLQLPSEPSPPPAA